MIGGRPIRMSSKVLQVTFIFPVVLHLPYNQNEHESLIKEYLETSYFMINVVD